MTHTPGPWFVTDEWNPLILSNANGGVHVAQVLAYSDGITGTHRPQADADARLIAAAPDLLDALRDLLAATDPTYDSRHECEAARAAITKATT